MEIAYEVAVAIAIGGVIAATLFRTFLPLFIKYRAEHDLAERENRPMNPIRIENVWLYMAGINIIIMGFPLFATIDQFVQPVIETTGVFQGFFIVFALANTSLEGLFRLADTGVAATTNTKPAENTSPTTPP